MMYILQIVSENKVIISLIYFIKIAVENSKNSKMQPVKESKLYCIFPSKYHKRKLHFKETSVLQMLTTLLK